jgi:hypothetical protein
MMISTSTGIGYRIFHRFLHTAAVICLLLGTSATPLQTFAQAATPQSTPERSNYEQTSRYADVVKFFQELQRQSPLLRVASFGKTNEERDLPLVIISDPPVFTPREAHAAGKPIVFVMANIHAGEVEGKESVQHLSRRLVSGDLRPLVDKLVILFAPIYNADGNERVQARSRQNGPIGPVGQRENAQGFDLNRDYTKLEAPETRALVKLFNEWDPHLTVDLHTTNGSYHAYHLTYSIPLNPSIDPRLASYHRDQMMPAITKAMLEKHGRRTYYYGNFSTDGGRGGRGGRGRGRRGGGGERGGSGERGAGGERGEGGAAGDRGEPPQRGDQSAAQPTPTANQSQPAAGAQPAAASQPAAGAQTPAAEGPPPLRRWVAFSSLPRVGQNYVGMRNRLTILSEAYSYLDFKGRIDTTAQFVEEILRYAIDHADEIRVLTRQADMEQVRSVLAGNPPRIGVEYEQRPLPEPVEILVGQVTRVENPRTGGMMTAMIEDAVTPERMLDYGTFVALRHVQIGQAYAFPPEDGLKVVVEKLLAHGITVEQLTQPFAAEAQYFRIGSVNRAASAVQQHNEVSLVGAFDTEQTEFPAGTYIVRTAQPLGRLAAYLLEPESDDSLSTWNFLDEYHGEGKVYPIKKLMKPVTAASVVVTE